MPKERKKKDFIIFFFLIELIESVSSELQVCGGPLNKIKPPLPKNYLKLNTKITVKYAFFFLLSFVQINTGNTVGVKGTKKCI